MAIYSSSGLTVELGRTEILRDLDFAVESGQWIGLLGPNGAGKTTLLRTLAGLIEYRGSLKLLDREIRDYRPRERAKQLALVRQTHTLAFDFRVDELVLLGRSPHKSLLSVYEKSDLDRVSEALSLVDLDGFTERNMSSLSGGEQQRVFLAQALVQEPDILLLDEPTTHLDVHHQYEFLYRVQEFISEGKTVVGAFHDLELAARFSDHLFVLQHGELVASGPPEKILDESLIANVFQMDASVSWEGGPAGDKESATVGSYAGSSAAAGSPAGSSAADSSTDPSAAADSSAGLGATAGSSSRFSTDTAAPINSSSGRGPIRIMYQRPLRKPRK